jgi:hypothetical protein
MFVYNLTVIIILVSLGLDFVKSGRYERMLSPQGQVDFIEKLGPVIAFSDRIASMVPSLYTTVFVAFTKTIYNIAIGAIKDPTVPEKWLKLDGVTLTGAFLADASGTGVIFRETVRGVCQFKKPSTTELAFGQQVIRLMGLQGTTVDIPGVPLRVIDMVMFHAAFAAVTILFGALSNLLVIANRQTNWKSRNSRLL